MHPPADEYLRLLYSPAVLVKVQPNQDIELQLRIPEQLLTTKCSYFQSLIDYTLQNIAPAVTDRPEPVAVVHGHSVQAFKVFAFWLYTNDLPYQVEDNDHPLTRTVNFNRSRIRDFLEAWLLFDHLRLPAQQNHAMSRLCAIIQVVGLEPDLIVESDIQLIGQNRQHKQLDIFKNEILMLCVISGTWSGTRVRDALTTNGLPTDILEYRSTAANSERLVKEQFANTRIADWNRGMKNQGLEVPV